MMTNPLGLYLSVKIDAETANMGAGIMYVPAS